MNDLKKLINFKPTGIKVNSGKFLISEPLIPDPIFKRSVLFLAEYDSDGAFGLIVNKPTDYKVSDVVDTFGKCDMPVYIGGPVHTDQLFFLHSIGLISGSYEVIDGVYWGGDLTEVKAMLHTGEINENNFRFFIGYSGWTSMQLEDEIKKESWLIAESTKKEIFSEQAEKLWVEKVKSFGNQYQNWLNIPINPQMN